MRKWTKTDAFLTVFVNLLSIAVTVFIVGSNFLPGVYTLFFVPLFFSAVLACLLKQRGRYLRFFALFLAVLDVLLLAALINSNKFAQMLHRLSGSYNIEATLFSLAILLLYCLGMLIGLGLGTLLSNRLGTAKRRNPDA